MLYTVVSLNLYNNPATKVLLLPPLYRRRGDPRLREVKGLAHNYVDLGHGGRAGFRIQASLPVALVLSYSVYSARTQDRMT